MCLLFKLKFVWSKFELIKSLVFVFFFQENETVFSEGENVLCFHGKQLYEARVQAVDSDLETPKYYIHYMGWNSKWDEWVSF